MTVFDPPAVIADVGDTVIFNCKSILRGSKTHCAGLSGHSVAEPSTSHVRQPQRYPVQLHEPLRPLPRREPHHLRLQLRCSRHAERHLRADVRRAHHGQLYDLVLRPRYVQRWWGGRNQHQRDDRADTRWREGEFTPSLSLYALPSPSRLCSAAYIHPRVCFVWIASILRRC